MVHAIIEMENKAGADKNRPFTDAIGTSEANYNKAIDDMKNDQAFMNKMEEKDKEKDKSKQTPKIKVSSGPTLKEDTSKKSQKNKTKTTSTKEKSVNKPKIKTQTPITYSPKQEPKNQRIIINR